MSDITGTNENFSIEFTKLGLEDIFWGESSQQVERFGEAYTITEINAGNMPFNASQTLQEVLDTNYPSVEIVGANMAEVIAVGENLASVITCATNIVLIANAEGYALVAQASATAALASENLAKQWAENPEDVEVITGQYSAYHWAQKAEEIVVGESIFLPLAGGTMSGDITFPVTKGINFNDSTSYWAMDAGSSYWSLRRAAANMIYCNGDAKMLRTTSTNVTYNNIPLVTTAGAVFTSPCTFPAHGGAYFADATTASDWLLRGGASSFILAHDGNIMFEAIPTSKRLNLLATGMTYDGVPLVTTAGAVFTGYVRLDDANHFYSSLDSSKWRAGLGTANEYIVSNIGTQTKGLIIDPDAKLLAMTSTDVTYNGISLTGAGADELPELLDVSDTVTSGATDGQVLTFNSTSGEWEAADQYGDIPTVDDFTVAVENQTTFTVDYNAQNVSVLVGGIEVHPDNVDTSSGTEVVLPPQDIGTWVRVISNSDAPGTVAMNYSDLLDVDPTLNPNEGDIVRWNDTASQWESGPNDSSNMEFTQAIIFDEVYDNGTKTANFTIIPSTNQYQKVTINANCTMTLSPAPSGPCTINLHIFQGATGGVITWPTAKWESGTEIANTTTPTTGYDLLIMQYVDATVGWVFGLKKDLS